MTDSLLDPGVNAAPANARPSDVPEKFWDSAAGAMRVDALLKSYSELEKRLSQKLTPPGPDATPEEIAMWRDAMGIPASAGDYQVNETAGLGIDPEVNVTLHKAGFTQAQAQLVYDLAAERLLPLIGEAAQAYEAERQVERLVTHFGSEERFRRIAKQISAWGTQHLPKPVFDALSTTFEGVLAMERMMAGTEPVMARDSAPLAAPSEAELRQMMRDPRYWQKREPAFVQKVTEGFRRLVNG
jgi:hypothetical protein